MALTQGIWDRAENSIQLLIHYLDQILIGTGSLRRRMTWTTPYFFKIMQEWFAYCSRILQEEIEGADMQEDVSVAEEPGDMRWPPVSIRCQCRFEGLSIL